MRKKILETVGNYTFTADVQEDVQALSLLKRKGLVAFVVTLRRGAEVVGQGRAIAIINRWNRYFEKVIQSTASAALLDAIAKSTRADILDVEAPASGKATPEITIGEAYRVPEGEISDELATDRQKSYLRELLMLNIEDEREREVKISQIDELTKLEASHAIKALAS